MYIYTYIDIYIYIYIIRVLLVLFAGMDVLVATSGCGWLYIFDFRSLKTLLPILTGRSIE